MIPLVPTGPFRLLSHRPVLLNAAVQQHKQAAQFHFSREPSNLIHQSNSAQVQDLSGSLALNSADSHTDESGTGAAGSYPPFCLMRSHKCNLLVFGQRKIEIELQFYVLTIDSDGLKRKKKEKREVDYRLPCSAAKSQWAFARFRWVVSHDCV